MYIKEKYFDGDVGYQHSGWETNAHPITNASENLAGRVENKPRQMKFCIGCMRLSSLGECQKILAFQLKHNQSS